MKKLSFLIFAAVLFLGVSLLFSCAGDDDDDDSDDDVSSFGDDDAGDDDADDDETDDDDVFDDDAADDDVIADTWTDSSSGLTWQATPESDARIWDDATTYCDGLALAGGGWRLPTVPELRTLIRGCDITATGGACGVTDECLDSSCDNDSCQGCDDMAGPGSFGAYWPPDLSGYAGYYWSSSPVTDLDGYAWGISFTIGYIYYYEAVTEGYARCVR